jgi:hypothetical protein
MNEEGKMEDQVIEVQQETGLTPITDDTLISLAEQAEKRIDAMNKIKRVAIKLTNRHDWTDQGGKPYLQVSGAEKIARMFGISWRISEPIKETIEGGHFSFTYKGYFSLAGATIEAIGTRSSKDGFFKKYGYENGQKQELPASEIDAGDVKKSAYTNCIGNGITRLLGIRNLTYEDLREFAGLSQADLGRVDYKKKGKADAGIQEESVQKIVSQISDVRKQTGKTKAGKDFTKYIIKNGNAEYSTFSESNAKIAKEAKDSAMWAEIHYKQTQYGNDLTAICLVDPPPESEEAAS